MRLPPAVSFASCATIWGTTWFAIKIGYEGLDPIWGAALRFLLAGLLLVPITFLTRSRWPQGARQVNVVLFVGVVLFGLDYGLIYWGEQFVPSGLTAILFATMPLFVGIFNALLVPSERITTRHALGICTGFLGLLLVFQQELGTASASLAGMTAIVGSAGAAAIASVVVRRWGGDLSPVTLNASAMLVGGVALMAASLLLSESPAPPRTASSWISLLYLVVLGSIVSFLLYWDLLKRWGANKSGLIPILTPVIAVTTGVLAGERLSLLQWVGSAIVLFAVAFALLPLGRFARRKPAVPDGP